MCIISIATALGSTTAAALAASVGTGAATAAGATVTTTTATAIGAVVIDVGILAVAAGTAGSVVGMVSGMEQAEQAKQQAEFQTQIAEENQRLSLRRAENIELEANQKRAALLDRYNQQRGTDRTGYAAAGVILGSGSSAEHEADLTNVYDLDLKNLEYEVASDVWKTKVSGIDYANQAKMHRAQAGAYDSGKGLTLLSGIADTTATALGGTINLMTSLSKLPQPKTDKKLS